MSRERERERCGGVRVCISLHDQSTGEYVALGMIEQPDAWKPDTPSSNHTKTHTHVQSDI